FREVGVSLAPSKSKDKIRERLWRLFGQLASDNAPTRTTARRKLDELLIKQGLDWNAFTSILLAHWVASNPAPAPAAGPSVADDDPLTFNVLELMLSLFEEHCVLTPAERLVVTLWTLTSHVITHYDHAPQLTLISPTSGFGKTTL